jgi:hypothetical protein
MYTEVKNLKGRGSLEELGIDGRLITKLISVK